MKIAFICTGNTARSQIAEALAKHYVKKLNKNIEIFSAGSNPAGIINPYAIKVLEEVGISTDGQYSKLFITH
jgi:arsenate reductase